MSIKRTRRAMRGDELLEQFRIYLKEKTANSVTLRVRLIVSCRLHKVEARLREQAEHVGASQVRRAAHILAY